jgi:hypothetical protein
VAKGCPVACPPGFVCDRASGECVRPAGPAPGPTSVKCRIISLYEWRGKPTLHLDCRAPGRVRPGQVGTVLEGESDRPLPHGEIKVLKVLDHRAIARTRLETVGIHRWVRIDTP